MNASVPLSVPMAMFARLGGLVPGIALCAGIALAAVVLQRSSGIPGLSPLILAMGLGVGLRALTGPLASMGPGAAFTLRRLLRLAIMALGFQLTIAQLQQVGLSGVLAIIVTLVSTFLFTRLMGRVIGVEPRLAELIAAGTAICGASAIIACNSVTRGRDEDVAYAVTSVTLLGTVAMVLFPLLDGPLGLTPRAYGLWAGTSLHEVAQVVAASFALGDVAGQSGTVAKLARVMMLAPMILTLGAVAARGKGSTGRAPMPWFVLGFIAIVALNSATGGLPAAWQGRVVTATTFLLTMTLAAMGLETNLHHLRKAGLRPLALAVIAALFVAVVGLGAVVSLAA